jgi:hypothetical protein
MTDFGFNHWEIVSIQEFKDGAKHTFVRVAISGKAYCKKQKWNCQGDSLAFLRPGKRLDCSCCILCAATDRIFSLGANDG